MDRALPAPPALGRETTTDWLSVALVVLSGIVAALQVGKVPTVLPAMRADLGLDLEAIGWVMATFALLGVVGGIPAGAAVNRFGDRRLLLLGLVAIASGSVAGGLAGAFSTLLAARVLEGAGALLIVVAAPAVLDRVAARRDRDRVFGIWGTFMPAGVAIALLAGLALEGGWRGFWFFNAGLVGLVGVALLLGVPRVSPSAPDLSWNATLRDAGRTASSAGPVLLALAFAVYSIQYVALVGFLPVLLGERLGVSAATAGVLSAVVVAANILGNLGAGALLARGAARWRLMTTASAVMGLSGIGIFMPDVPAAMVFLFCLVFSGVGGLLPATVLGGTPHLAPLPRLAPVAMGLLVQGSNLGQMIGPVVVGAAVDAAGWPAAAIPVGIAAALGVIIAAAVRPAFRSAGARETERS